MTKVELLQIVKANRPAPEYRVDSLLKQHGHTILRLPPYHCDLNPIEYIWSIVKHRVAFRNVSSNIKEIWNKTECAANSVTVQEWKNGCKHVIGLESKYRTSDGLLESEVERLEINLDSDSNSSAEDSEDDSASDISGVFPL